MASMVPTLEDQDTTYAMIMALDIEITAVGLEFPRLRASLLAQRAELRARADVITRARIAAGHTLAR